MPERKRAGGRATAWPAAWSAGARAGARRHSGWVADLLRRGLEYLRGWSLGETGPGRLIVWLPIAFGAGIALYFTAQQEPALWAALVLLAVSVTATFTLRARPATFAVAALLAAAAGGFATATLRTVIVEHPVLVHAVFGAELSGWIENREERERTDRLTIAVARMEGRRVDTPLQRVRVSVRKGTAPPVGSFVSFKARLSPPLAPLRPGGYDFARDLYFQGIGASGFVLGRIERREAPAPPSARLRYRVAVAGARDAIDARIRASLPGDAGAIASALITGKRDAISAPLNEAMYVSSLAHVLSISGYHMAVVAGVVFFLVRALLALSSTLALRYPINKWAAAAALLAATGYLILSGAEVATQRSYVKTGIVLIGVLVDRAALTLRNLAVAALVVLLLTPEAIVHPSFQMSFAATLALVAAYERGLPWTSARAETSFAAKMALWGGREIVALTLASLVAGFATTLYAAYHFHRLAPYGVLANLLAMPVVSAWVMPMGLLGLVAIPFGFDGLFWPLMGYGIDWMTGVAMWVASLPGAVGRIAAFGIGPLLLGTAALIALCLLRSPLRWAGCPIAALAIYAALRTPVPEVLIAPGAEAVAFRTDSAKLAAMKVGSDAFAVREWLAADADARSPGSPDLSSGFSCDALGCVGRLAHGAIIAIPLTAEAFDEDCRTAAVVISKRAAPPGCKALVFDRTTTPVSGAVALFRNGEQFHVVAARPPGYDRPWARAAQERRAESAAAPTSGTPTPDATPSVQDLRPDD